MRHPAVYAKREDVWRGGTIAYAPPVRRNSSAILTMKTMSEKFEIKESGSFGRGVFAVKPINKDEQILEFTGPIISSEQALQKPMDKMSCPLQIESTKYIDIQEPGVLVNHSCSPNTGIKNDRFLVALKDILPGQEIFYDYSTTMDEDNWTLSCECGCQNCRHTIGDFRHLPLDVQKKYFELNIVQSFIRGKLLMNIAEHGTSGSPSGADRANLTYFPFGIQ
ncbi:SET domain-containing protein-lysine N-methyltransferase [Candidatus Uhrbacteria bacterium]|nr:SET domain-containing protein-lysine N-methyltransferase [Candidatus Uhrbacteria bacterium]